MPDETTINRLFNVAERLEGKIDRVDEKVSDIKAHVSTHAVRLDTHAREIQDLKLVTFRTEAAVPEPKGGVVLSFQPDSKTLTTLFLVCGGLLAAGVIAWAKLWGGHG